MLRSEVERFKVKKDQGQKATHLLCLRDAGGIMFSGCPSVRPSVHPSVGPKPEIPSFHLYMGTLVHLTNHGPYVRLSVHLERFLVMSPIGKCPENAWREWPESLHADVSWPLSELIRLWSWSVDFFPFGEMGQIWGFQAFPRERMEGMSWNFACWLS